MMVVVMCKLTTNVVNDNNSIVYSTTNVDTCLIVGYLPQWMSLKVGTLDVYFMDEQTTSKTLDISLHTGTSPACVAQHRQWVQHISHNILCKQIYRIAQVTKTHSVCSSIHCGYFVT